MPRKKKIKKGEFEFDTGKEFAAIVNKLKPKARRDVLDFAYFITWKAYPRPVPLKFLPGLFHGFWLWVLWEAEHFFKPKVNATDVK